MRFKNLFLQDMHVQARYGFYFLYAVLTVIYTIILFAVPAGWREKTAALLIFSDPASMGLFFMGAIVLLEKSEHTPCALAVSPVRPLEYVLAKAGSLSVISLAVAAVLAGAAGAGRLLLVLPGTFLAGMIFTLCAIITATKIKSLNQFLLWTVPVESVCFVPAVLHLFQITPETFRNLPVNVCMDLIAGRTPSAAGIFIVTIVILALLAASEKCVLKMWQSTGGAKL